MKFGVTHHYRAGKVLSSPALKFHLQSAAESHNLLLHIFVLRKICPCFPVNGNGMGLSQVSCWQATNIPSNSAFHIHTWAGNCLPGCELDHDPTLASSQLSLPGLSDSREINVLRPVVYVTG